MQGKKAKAAPPRKNKKRQRRRSLSLNSVAEASIESATHVDQEGQKFVEEVLQGAKVVVFEKTNDGFSNVIKHTMVKYNFAHHAVVYVDVDKRPDGDGVMKYLRKLCGAFSECPWVFVQGKYLGSCEDVVDMDQMGKLREIFLTAGALEKERVTPDDEKKIKHATSLPSAHEGEMDTSLRGKIPAIAARETPIAARETHTAARETPIATDKYKQQVVDRPSQTGHRGHLHRHGHYTNRHGLVRRTKKHLNVSVVDEVYDNPHRTDRRVLSDDCHCRHHPKGSHHCNHHRPSSHLHHVRDDDSSDSDSSDTNIVLRSTREVWPKCDDFSPDPVIYDRKCYPFDKASKSGFVAVTRGSNVDDSSCHCDDSSSTTSRVSLVSVVVVGDESPRRRTCCRVVTRGATAGCRACSVCRYCSHCQGPSSRRQCRHRLSDKTCCFRLSDGTCCHGPILASTVADAASSSSSECACVYHTRCVLSSDDDSSSSRCRGLSLLAANANSGMSSSSIGIVALDTLSLRHLVRKLLETRKVVVFAKSDSTASILVKQALWKYKIPKEDMVFVNVNKRKEHDEIIKDLKKITGSVKLPRVFIHGICIGDGKELLVLDEEDQLRKFLVEAGVLNRRRQSR